LLDGKDRQRLLWDWVDVLEQTMACEGGAAIPNQLTHLLADPCPENDHPGS
jgi:hypothetical protein